MPNDSTFPPDLVTAHASSLRALARSLALDEHAADDVVQETWLRALSSPPARDTGIGGWLRRVAEGFALQRHRSEARRAHREKMYARERPEAAASADSRAETLRAVVEAVLSLEEPYRETVLLRWFEGLPPRDIAARQRVTVATVNSRLQRAHGLLRERLSHRLDVDDRKLQGLLLSIFGTDWASAATSGAAAGSSISLVGVTMTMKLVLAGGIAAFAMGAWAWIGGGGDRIAQPPVAASNSAAGIGSALPADADPGVGERRVELGSVEPSPAAPIAPPADAGPYEFDLTVLTVDSNGRPVSRVPVSIGLDMQRLAGLGISAWNGELRTTWRGHDPRLEMVLGVERTRLRRIQLAAGAPARVVLVVAARPGSTSFESRVALTQSAASAAPRAESTGFSRDAEGNGVFTDAWLLSREETVEPRIVRESSGMRISETQERVTSLRSQAVKVDHAIPNPAKISGVVRDENGAPLPGVLVTALTEADSGRWESTSDVYGEFTCAVPSGRVIVLAGGEGLALARKETELRVDETGTFDFQCPKLAMTSVRLLDADKKPLGEWRIEGRRAGDDGIVTGRGVTDAQGRAKIFLANGRLHVAPAASASVLTALLDVPAPMPGEETEIVLGKDAVPGTMSVVIEAATPPGGEVRLWRADSNEGQRMRLVDVSLQSATGMHRALYRCEKLMPGEYTIEHGAPGVPWSELGPFYLGSGQVLDAGTHRLDEPARLAVEVADGAKTNVMVRARVQGLVLQSPMLSVTQPVELKLESGDWTLSTDVEDAGAAGHSSRAIQVEPGQRVQAFAPLDAQPR